LQFYNFNKSLITKSYGKGIIFRQRSARKDEKRG
jgi:hypothetical protein